MSLEAQEIKAIIETCMPDKEDMLFFITDRIAQEEPLTSDTCTQSASFHRFQETFQSPEGTCTGLFFIYEKATGFALSDLIPTHISKVWKQSTEPTLRDVIHTATTKNTDGHWYCVVAHKKDNQRRYICADSSNNPSRITHRRFLELKALLEGKEFEAPETFTIKHLSCCNKDSTVRRILTCILSCKDSAHTRKNRT